MAAGKATKAERVAKGVKDAVGAGRPVALETVDFSDPDRPLTCLEVDFPIIPVNQVAIIEGNAGKPIYQVSKWWARRRSSVFRSLLLSAATKAPDDPLDASKRVWDAYYANHQKKGAFSKLKVVDPFMGGGTTIIEGSRLGMQMTGVDLNPVAWFVVQSELAKVDREEVEALLADVEREVKPQIMPFYALDCPRGHKGTWTRVSTGEIMGEDFDPLALSTEQRADYRYDGPEVLHVFWAKHGPCQVTGCGHRTPVMSSPVMAVKTLTLRAWSFRCRSDDCRRTFDVEEADARMAPGSPLVVADTESLFAVCENVRVPVSGKRIVDFSCPSCGHAHRDVSLVDKAARRKKIELSVLVSKDWLAGAPSDQGGAVFGGSPSDDAAATSAWNQLRAATCRLVEIRGALPASYVDPVTGLVVSTSEGTVPKRSHYACGSCGTVQDVLSTVKASGKAGPVAAYAVQGYCPCCDKEGVPYGGRFFEPLEDASKLNAAIVEWEHRREGDLATLWPRSAIPYGFMTAIANGDIREGHGFTHWWTLFNPRQLLLHSQLLRAIRDVGADSHSWDVRMAVLAAWQPYLRNQCMLAFWHMSRDHFAPALSNSNFHPKSTLIEVGAFPPVGYGPWPSAVGGLSSAMEWTADPWELVSTERLTQLNPALGGMTSGKSEKAFPGDPVLSARLLHGSATDLPLEKGSVDLVITDPPFGGLLHYSELSDFFYVWLRLVLRDRYPGIFDSEHVPKSLEIVENRARNPEDAAEFYQRLLTAAWAESYRILKPGGILAFTFHHSEDEPWVAVLESLFDAGFYLEATYPIRSDETKGEGEFGSKTVEYDIIHVCRKRTAAPQPVSWAKMRREILKEVRRLQSLLEHHQRDGLPAADIQVIKRGKALEYYSKHYGQVYEAEGEAMSVKEAVLGVLQVLDEETSTGGEAPPAVASPYTRQVLRMFQNTTSLARDQVQKYLRGTGIAPSEFEDRGWVVEEKKVYHLRPFIEVAQAWHRKHKAGIQHDYDQAAILIGACVEGSGINAEATLNNTSFKPHPALPALLEWFATRATDSATRVAAARAQRLYTRWASTAKSSGKTQLALFGGEEEGA